MKTKRKHPSADWPWWKITGAGLIGFGTFGLLIAFMPPRTNWAVIIGIASIIFAVPAGLWNWKVYSWSSRLTLSALWSIQVFIIGYRAWIQVYPTFWLYLIFCAYLLAWILPALYPTFAKLIWREQTAPQTRLGRVILSLSLSLVPIAGVFGSSIGIFKSRFEGILGTYMIAGPLSFVAVILIVFSYSYQLWLDRPWLKYIEE